MCINVRRSMLITQSVVTPPGICIAGVVIVINVVDDALSLFSFMQLLLVLFMLSLFAVVLML